MIRAQILQKTYFRSSLGESRWVRYVVAVIPRRYPRWRHAFAPSLGTTRSEKHPFADWPVSTCPGPSEDATLYVCALLGLHPDTPIGIVLDKLREEHPDTPGLPE